jgi:hypothetical protein
MNNRTQGRTQTQLKPNELASYCRRWAATVGRYGAKYPGPMPEKFIEIADTLERLMSELEGYRAWERSINESLIVEMGVYRP